MSRLASLVAVLLFALPATADPGPLVIIGGALDPGNEAVYRAILNRRLAGKPICVLPVASGQPKRAMASYVEAFRGYGGPAAAAGVAITAKRAGRAADPKIVASLASCGGVFFAGGDQSRIVDVLRPGGEPSAADQAIRELWMRGGVVAGTSAGAAMMSNPRIGGGSSNEAFTHGVTESEDALGVWVRGAMGFLPSALIDQHCLERGRLGRLIVAVAERSERRLGLCIDEDTALVVEGGQAFVLGASAVAVLDLETASRSGAGRGFRDGRLWLLGDGDRFDLESGRATPDGDKRPWEPESPEPLAAVAPANPWMQDAFHRFLVDFVGSTAGVATAGRGPGRIRLRTSGGFAALSPDGFGALSLDGEQPRALFAGPIEIDWLPEAPAGEPCNLIVDPRRTPMIADDFQPLDPEHEKRLTRVFDGAHFSHLLGMQVEEIRRDYGRLRLRFKPELLHPGGVVHGGAIASLIDTAAALAILSGLDGPPRSSATIDLHVHYLEAVASEDLIAQAAIRRRGRSIIVVAVDAATASGKPVAHGELSFRVVP